MQKNKIVIIILTFLIMIGLTPFIFGKIMNSKFNTMILELQQQKNIKIKELKNKSSYLTTNRVFEITIPGRVLNQADIKSIQLLTEVKFKNLPVTNVEFLNTIKKIILINNKKVPLIDNKIKIAVITPDFKIYKYKVFDNSIDLKNKNTLLEWKNFSGIYNEKNKTLKNENGLIELKNSLNSLKIYNIKIFMQDVYNKKIQQLHFDANFSNKKLKININNFDLGSKIDILANSIKLKSTAKCNEINVNNMIKINQINSDFEVDGLDKKVYEKLKNKSYTQKDMDELLKKGFSGKFNLGVKNIFFIQDLGFINLKSQFNLKNASIAKIHNNDLSFLDLNLSFETSPKLIDIMANVFNPIKQIAIIKNNKAFIDIKINKGKITINGKQIKSN